MMSAEFEAKTEPVQPEDIGDVCPVEWQQEIGAVSFTKVTLTFVQAGIVRTVNCVFPGGTENGEVTKCNCTEAK